MTQQTSEGQDVCCQRFPCPRYTVCPYSDPPVTGANSSELLQDASSKLSRALASKPDAPMHAREAAAQIAAADSAASVDALDARRYRWLQFNLGISAGLPPDAAIDAAMKGEGA